MQRPKPWDSYRRVATQTASPAHLVLMLYDGAIGFLERAVAGFDARDPGQINQAVNINIVRAQAIIYEMNASLNMDAGGDISLNFRRLYNYFYTRLRVLRDTWAEMLRRGPAPAGPFADRPASGAGGRSSFKSAAA